MEYVTPPRAASILLNLFASEADFALVLGDLSEELQSRASAEGHAPARRWYWRESFRNAFAWVRREFLRTPAKALVVSLITGLGAFGVIVLIVSLMTDVQWAWIRPRHWQWFRYLWLVLVPSLLYLGSGAIAGILVKGREFAVAISFVAWTAIYLAAGLCILSYSAAKGRLPVTVNLFQVSERFVVEWAWMVLLYAIGCLWIRRRRLADAALRAE